MIQLSGSALISVRPLFDGINGGTVLLRSCLEGCMGAVRADDAAHPRVALATLGDFSFCAGDPDAPAARELAEQVLDVHCNRFALVIPQNDEWARLLRDAHDGRWEGLTRYAIRHEGDRFDRNHLRSLANGLPAGYHLCAIEEDLYRRCSEEEWSKDFCSQFPTYADYAARGLGVTAMRGKEMVAGASSYCWVPGGIEIEVDTREECRRQGLAAACCAQLMLNALEKGLIPTWDAATRISVRLAEKLGYRFSHEYSCLLLKR